MFMRIAPLGMTCLLLLLAAAQDNTRQDNASRDAQSKLLAVENIWNQAEIKGDAKALALIFDDFLVYVDEDGTMLTKTQFLARAKAAGEHLQTLSTQSMRAQIYGETAVVTGTYRVKGVERGKPYQRDGRFTDIWILRNGSWVCAAAQATPIPR